MRTYPRVAFAPIACSVVKFTAGRRGPRGHCESAPMATARKIRPNRHTGTSHTFSYPHARIVSAMGVPDTNACRGATGNSAVSSGTYASASAVHHLPPPPLPPTDTFRPKGRLLTTAATRTESGCRLSHADAFATQFVD